MTKSIFDIEIRLDYQKEFNKMVSYFHIARRTTLCGNHFYSLIDAINNKAFKKWPYRGTAIFCEEYLEEIGLSEYMFTGKSSINEYDFLLYLEFMYNIINFSLSNQYISIISNDVQALVINMDIIAEKMNYGFIKNGDKYILTKRNSSIDSILSLVENNIGILLLEYNDFKVASDISRKSEILKAIDIFIEKEQSEYSKLDNDSYRSWGYILNNFGINHKINSKYKDMSKEDLLKWYDKAFMLAIHLIRIREIKEINKERKDLEK